MRGARVGRAIRGVGLGSLSVFVWVGLAACEIRIADGPAPDVRVDTGTAAALDGAFDADPAGCADRDLVPCALEDAETREAALRRRLDKVVLACSLAGHTACGTLRFHFSSGCLVGLEGPWERNFDFMACVVGALVEARLECAVGAPELVLSPCDG